MAVCLPLHSSKQKCHNISSWLHGYPVSSTSSAVIACSSTNCGTVMGPAAGNGQCAKGCHLQRLRLYYSSNVEDEGVAQHLLE